MYYFDLLKLECFTRQDVEKLTGSKTAAAALLLDYQKKEYIERFRQNMYVVKELDTKWPVMSPYQLCSRINEDACISHHTAFEYYGCAEQVFFEMYVSSSIPFRPFEYDNLRIKHVKSSYKKDVVQHKGTVITTPEQTVIDSIDAINKISFLEETLKCTYLLKELHEGKLVQILKRADKDILWQKTGYILKTFQQQFDLSNEFFDLCKQHINGGTHKLTSGNMWRMHWNKEWFLYAPADLNYYLEGEGYGITET